MRCAARNHHLPPLSTSGTTIIENTTATAQTHRLSRRQLTKHEVLQVASVARDEVLRARVVGGLVEDVEVGIHVREGERQLGVCTQRSNGKMDGEEIATVRVVKICGRFYSRRCGGDQ